MRFTLTHRTAYTYASAVHESFNEVRLQPVSGRTQTCLDFDLTIDPPATVITFRDYYGNVVHDFGVPYLHDHLTVEAKSDVVTFADADVPLSGPRGDEPDGSPPLARLANDPLIADEYAEYLSPSTYVALDAASAQLARVLLATAPETTTFAFLQRASVYIRDHFTYQLGTTNVHSTVADVIAGGSGVCQDFAHLLLSLCRHAGLPARYVSGYLGDITDSGASHAWAEAFVPPYGWVGVDATLGIPCTGRHVKIAVGRDYADVAVVRGTYRGGAEAMMAVEVHGAVRDESQGLTMARAPGRDRTRGKLIQYQTVGAMSQLQRLGAMTQTLGTMTQTMRAEPGYLPGQPDESDVPRQQPQQQQQECVPTGHPTGWSGSVVGERDGGQQCEPGTGRIRDGVPERGESTAGEQPELRGGDGGAERVRGGGRGGGDVHAVCEQWGELRGGHHGIFRGGDRHQRGPRRVDEPEHAATGAIAR